MDVHPQVLIGPVSFACCARASSGQRLPKADSACRTTLYCAALCCNVLPCAALLQRVATCWNGRTALQHVALCCTCLDLHRLEPCTASQANDVCGHWPFGRAAAAVDADGHSSCCNMGYVCTRPTGVGWQIPSYAMRRAELCFVVQYSTSRPSRTSDALLFQLTRPFFSS
jgi:hypothetical protein